MKLVFHGVLITLTLCLAIGCSSRSINTEMTTCVYPDSNRTAAPSFICDSSIDGYPVTALRNAEPSEEAISDVIQGLFDDQISVWATQWSIQWYPNDQDQAEASQWLVVFLSEKGRVIRSRVSPKNHLWVVVGLPLSSVQIRAKLGAAMALP